MAGYFGGTHPAAQRDIAKLILATGIVIIAILALLAYGILSSKQHEQQIATEVIIDSAGSIKMTDVLVAVREVPGATRLESGMFRRESRPMMEASDRIIRDFSEISGHYSRSIIIPGQPLHRDYVTPIRPVNVITEQIPEGYRAVTVRIDERTGVEGFIAPGSHVDVEWASSIRGQPAIDTIVQNAKVISLQGQTQSSQNSHGSTANTPRTATLLVTAQDAQRIQLASTAGQLSLSLRGDGDNKIGSLRSLTMRDLIGGAQETKDPLDPSQGTMIMDGKKYLVVNGKLIPAVGER